MTEPLLGTFDPVEADGTVDADGPVDTVDTDAVDPAVLERLGDELGDKTAAQRIAGIYLGLLDERVRRLSEACDDGDLDAALERTLTLKVTSATVGAMGVCRCAVVIEGWLRAGGLCHLVEGLERLRHAAAETLRCGLGLPGPAASTG